MVEAAVDLLETEFANRKNLRAEGCNGVDNDQCRVIELIERSPQRGEIGPDPSGGLGVGDQERLDLVIGIGARVAVAAAPASGDGTRAEPDESRQTVPQTASFPISPPGKKIGLTT